jgi:hypothetical protein
MIHGSLTQRSRNTEKNHYASLFCVQADTGSEFVAEDCINVQSIKVKSSNTERAMTGRGKRKYREKKPAPEFFTLQDEFLRTTLRGPIHVQVWLAIRHGSGSNEPNSSVCG